MIYALTLHSLFSLFTHKKIKPGRNKKTDVLFILHMVQQRLQQLQKWYQSTMIYINSGFFELIDRAICVSCFNVACGKRSGNDKREKERKREREGGGISISRIYICIKIKKL